MNAKELELKLSDSLQREDVLKEMIAALEAKLAALAAENAGLKSAIENCINPDNQPEYHDLGMGCGVEDHGYQRDGYSACYYGWESAMERVYSDVIPDAIPETPATDAFLAEVRAQGVEMFATKAAEDLRTAGGAWGVIQEPYHEVADYLEDRGESFAAQLRQEAAQ